MNHVLRCAWCDQDVRMAGQLLARPGRPEATICPPCAARLAEAFAAADRGEVVWTDGPLAEPECGRQQPSLIEAAP